MDLQTFTMAFYMFVVLPLIALPIAIPSWIIQIFEALFQWL